MEHIIGLVLNTTKNDLLMDLTHLKLKKYALIVKKFLHRLLMADGMAVDANIDYVTKMLLIVNHISK